MADRPSVCRMVLAVGMGARNNGAEVAPAVITRVWPRTAEDTADGVWLVNATIFPDATQLIRAATSVYLHADEESARLSLINDCVTALYWPPRVGP